MSNFVYRCTRLDGTDKQGILTPDENGYYTICVGALDHKSKNINPKTGENEYYSSLGAEKFFAPGTLFNQRIAGGFIKAEYGHPSKVPGQTDMEFLERNIRIDEKLVCAVLGEIWLVPGYIDPLTGEKCVGIMAKVRPTGPYGEFLKKDLETKGANVCFSIRSLTTRQVINGKNCKVLHTVITFDYVNEPGISCAEKLVSPSLESNQPALPMSAEDAIVSHGGLDVEVSPKAARKLLANETVSVESGTASILAEIAKMDKKPTKSNVFMNW